MDREELKKHLYVLILCGGGGTRLWPRSRQKTPKQFLTNFFGKASIFTQTVNRARWLTTSEKIFVITNSDYVDEVLSQGKIISSRNIIAEPQAKNTALAMGVGATYIKKLDPEAIIINFPSDHLIEDKNLFIEQMTRAAEAAAGNSLVAVGIKPTFPHTGLGYIECKKDLGSQAILKASSFKEKPDLVQAKEFIKSGNCFWNAGIYVWTAQGLIEALRKHAPDTYVLLEKLEKSLGMSNEVTVLRDIYTEAENISIDYAVSEKADNLFLVPATFSWSDVGDWKVVYDLKPKDKESNVIESFGEQSRHLSIETNNCLIEAGDRLVATAGVSNLIIIETKEAVLVCSKDKAQEVKKIVERLKLENLKEYL